MANVKLGEFVPPPEAPFFEPTWDEFKDPMAFIDKIRAAGERFGICRIRPPPSWQPPFAVDTETFRFTPRIQKLNELEALSRVKMIYLDNLTKFWYLQGIQLRVPLVERRYLDIYGLQKVVSEEGGFEQVNMARKWQTIAARLGYGDSKAIGVTVRAHYEKLIYPYDVFLAGQSTPQPLSEMMERKEDNTSIRRMGRMSCGMTTSPMSTKPDVSIKPEIPGPVKLEASHLFMNESLQCKPRISPSKIETKPATLSAAVPIAICAKQDIKPAASGPGVKPILAPFKIDVPGATSIAAGATSPPPVLRCFSSGTKITIKTVPLTAVGAKNMSTKGGRGSNSVSPVRKGSTPATLPPPLIDDDDAKVETYFCKVCAGGDDEARMLLCDGCDDAYHTYCLSPPLTEIPPGDWLCPLCIAKEYKKPPEVYGFEQAQHEYSLESFGAMADQFKSDHFSATRFAASGGGRNPVPLATVEKEFWRLVNCLEENVSVEYGADIHAADHGSGFPTEKTRDRFVGDEEYITSGWNLNNLPVLKSSVLRHVSWNISGMKVPWCYVGMCFSSFAWHIEDHWSYSVNYLHWGEPKTWYGVPGSKAELLEECMKKSAPELFDQAPDLLHQLTTLMNPDTLMAYGVPIVRADQHAGEFIVTFPRAYHAGFNQGYNFAEAVNFCPADWLPIGRACVEHYREFHRECVFSHDELLCTMAQKARQLESSLAARVYDDLLVVVKEERALQKNILDKGVVLKEKMIFETLNDDERQCEFCKTTCFLSSVVCSCNKAKMVCSRHIDMLCTCDHSTLTSSRCMKYRYTFDELEEMLEALRGRADSPATLTNRVNAVLHPPPDTPKPDLSDVRELISEMMENDMAESDLMEPMKRIVERAERCVQLANQISRNKILVRQPRSDGTPVARLSIDELNNFCVMIEVLPCRIKEAVLIQELLKNVQVFQSESVNVLNAEQMPTVVKLNQMVDWGDSLDVELTELPKLRMMLNQAKWLHEVNMANGQHSKVTLPVLRKLIMSGAPVAAAHAACQVIMSRLKVLLAICEDLEQRASACLEVSYRPGVETLEAIVQESEAVSVSLPRVQTLKELVTRARTWSQTAQEALSTEHGIHVEQLSQMLIESSKIHVHLKLCEVIQSKLDQVEVWRNDVQRLYPGYTPGDNILEIIFPRAKVFHCSNEANSAKINSDLKIVLQDCSKLDSMMALFHSLETEVVQSILEARQAAMDSLQRRCTAGSEQCQCGRHETEHIHQCIRCTEKYFADCSFVQPTATVDPTTDLQSLSHTGMTFLCPFCSMTCATADRSPPTLPQILALVGAYRQMGVCLTEGRALGYVSDRAADWVQSARSVLDSVEVISAVQVLAKVVTLADVKPGGVDAGVIGKAGEGGDVGSSPEHKPTGPGSLSLEFLGRNGRFVLPTLLHRSEVACTRLIVELHVSDQTQSSLSDLLMEGLAVEVDIEEKHAIGLLLYACWQQKLLSKIRKKRHILRKKREMEEELKRRAEAEELRKKMEAEEAKRKIEAEALRKRLEVEERKKRIEAEQRRKKQEAEERKRRQEEEELRVRREEEEEEERRQQEAEQKRKRLKAEEEKKRKEAEEESRKQILESKENHKRRSTREAKDRKGSEKVEQHILDAIAALENNNNTSIMKHGKSDRETGESTAKKKKKKRTFGVVRSRSKRKQTGSSKVAEQGSEEEEEEEEEEEAVEEEDVNKKYEFCAAVDCLRPTGLKVDWIQCDACDEWYHMPCVGLTPRDVTDEGFEYICKVCHKSKSPTKKASSGGSKGSRKSKAAKTSNSTPVSVGRSRGTDKKKTATSKTVVVQETSDSDEPEPSKNNSGKKTAVKADKKSPDKGSGKKKPATKTVAVENSTDSDNVSDDMPLASKTVSGSSAKKAKSSPKKPTNSVTRKISTLSDDDSSVSSNDSEPVPEKAPIVPTALNKKRRKLNTASDSNKKSRRSADSDTKATTRQSIASKKLKRSDSVESESSSEVGGRNSSSDSDDDRLASRQGGGVGGGKKRVGGDLSPESSSPASISPPATRLTWGSMLPTAVSPRNVSRQSSSGSSSSNSGGFVTNAAGKKSGSARFGSSSQFILNQPRQQLNSLTPAGRSLGSVDGTDTDALSSSSSSNRISFGLTYAPWLDKLAGSSHASMSISPR